jgi:hypothetical protein
MAMALPRRSFVSRNFLFFQYTDAKALLTCAFLEETPIEAIFTCEKGIVKLNKRFHELTTLTLIAKEKEEIIDFTSETFGYNYEMKHFNDLLRKNKKESDILTFEFSKYLIKIVDSIRHRIGLEY